MLGSLLSGAVAVGAPASGQPADPPGHNWRPHETMCGSRPADAGPRATRTARDIALASTWHLDRALLRPHATDSPTTAAARRELATIDERLDGVMATYDDARDRAFRADCAARAARNRLSGARADQRRAEKSYRARRHLLVSVLTNDYVGTQLAPLSAVLTAEPGDDVVGELTLLQEMARVQSATVQAAEQARDRLRAATVALGQAESEARGRQEDARTALADAARARRSVLEDVRTSRLLLRAFVLQDRSVREAAAGGYAGRVTFPLESGATFVDQDNFGHQSARWASTHTGDDFSTVCGTPVRAVTAGTVLVRTDQAWSGRWLVMVATDHGSLTTWYAHMQTLDVTPGQLVEAGDRLGQVGEEGNATGCHLHLEVHPAGGTIYQDDTDPGQWLRTVSAYPDGA
ncbi:MULTISPECIES: peptidoglycan DD-metalloendopeptidase family protein [unclassified Nocardioides]|uniref:peptidoglycan DD-metalloendopeptidase family protein n=1 Tax=unclassified Nocardioides TaxID=2615069 RepID=UPI00361685CE